ncbi:aminotransferase family protein [Zymoseptoria brevis]|uniref:Aminotransferase family protein n=1 Tax=Zymoseptoria brevis TaxID=1047168 RepID=A0A0F4GA46_9PEZI|nr:aminotransferase family protein [Zymoseptoria brevis]
MLSARSPKMKKTLECGQEVRTDFALAPGYRNLNHGSYGTYPLPVRTAFRNFQELTEARPDAFVRYEYRTHLLDECRRAVEDYLHAPKDTCVFVPNATTGVETVLRNIQYDEGDVVIGFATLYEAFANTLRYLTQTTPLRVHMIEYTLPVSNAFLCDALEMAIKTIRSAGLRPRLLLFDTINTLPGVRMPFERLTKLCKMYDIWSCIDGAHGIGHIPLDLQDLDPDFFVTNCHKWLYTPRGSGILYVPVRNQHLLQSTLPTSFGFGDSFVANFASCGTLDDTPYLCVPDALGWRASLSWQGQTGEVAITSYMFHLARSGGEAVARILGTEVLENEDGTLGDCALTNVRLPIGALFHETEGSKVPEDIGEWIMRTMILERNTAVNVFLYADAWWARLSAPVYATLEDFEVAGRHLRELCESINK